MAQGEGGNGKVEAGVPPWPPGGGPDDRGIKARFTKIELAFDRLQADVSEIKAVLGRVDSKISAELPHLATKAEISGLVAILPHLATKAELGKRPTVAGIIAIVALVAAVASIPIWPEWVAAIKAIAAAGH
jgi:hypothetical protein